MEERFQGNEKAVPWSEVRGSKHRQKRCKNWEITGSRTDNARGWKSRSVSNRRNAPRVMWPDWGIKSDKLHCTLSVQSSFFPFSAFIFYIISLSFLYLPSVFSPFLLRFLPFLYFFLISFYLSILPFFCFVFVLLSLSLISPLSLVRHSFLYTSFFLISFPFNLFPFYLSSSRLSLYIPSIHAIMKSLSFPFLL